MSAQEIAVELKSVRKKFDGEHEVLKGIDLEIPKGKITVIIGFSGAGKSVMFKHILGLMRPDSGSIKVFGQDLSELNDVALNNMRKKFGMLFQSAALFDDMTTIENVCFPIAEFKRHLKPSEIQDIAAEKLKMVGLGSEHFNKYPAALSGGMKKRVGLARAIALDPDILLYDEPTTGLDPIITEIVDNLIMDTHKLRAGLTSIIISHDLPAAFRLADEIAMLDAGLIKLFGEPKVFLESSDPFIQKFVSKVKVNNV
ncbi:MAG: ATP-binding cassette domain-containing protein [Oligoflexia bacterium]|nr:ATP-binding cassette domain-containing protein [Oligoflexia bacterium]